MNKGTTIKLIAAIICTLLAAYLAYDISGLMAIDQLWGQRVLWLWIFLWSAVLFAFGEAMTTLPQKNKLLGASTLSGVLLAGGFMPLPTFFLMFMAFIPLLWVEHVISKERESTSKWTVFKFAFNSFFIWNILSTWWIQNSSFPAGILGNALNAVFMTVPFLFYHVTKKRMGTRAASFGFVSYWMTFEIGHLTWDLSWPWLTLGNSFAHIPQIVQWYEYTGVFGGGLWILSLNIILANILFDRLDPSKQQQPIKKLIVKPSLIFLLPILVSIVLYTTHNVESDDQVEIIAIQPNFEPHYQKFNSTQREQLSRFIRLSEEKLDDNTAYLIFPETSFWGINGENLEEAGVIQALKAFVSKYENLNLVSGIGTTIWYEEEDDRPEHIFTFCNDDRTICRYRDSHNAAIQINNEGDEIPYYKKSKLVPGAESMPFIGNIDLFRGFILDLGGAPGLSLGTQEEREVFSSKYGNVAPLICYESVYGDYVTDYVKNGAEAFFVVTNDGWWDNTIGHRQHMYLSSLRAIENRRYVVRSANTGVSCFINSRGDIYSPSKYDEAIAVKDSIYMRKDRTFYSYYGDLIGRVSILLSAWLLVSMLANGLKRRDPQE